VIYNDFVARVALEVIDSSWCKQQLRVKRAGAETLLSRRMMGHRGSRYSHSCSFCANTSGSHSDADAAENLNTLGD